MSELKTSGKRWDFSCWLNVHQQLMSRSLAGRMFQMVAPL